MKSVSIIFCLISILFIKSPASDYQTAGNGEFAVTIPGQNSYLITLTKVAGSTLWGMYSNGFPITTSYDGPYQVTASGFHADHIEDQNTSSYVVAYGLYELTIVVSSVTYKIYVDFRDADFGLDPSSYGQADLDIEFNATTHVWSAEGNTVSEGSTVPHWLTANKSSGTNNLDPFIPSNPTGLGVSNYNGNPKLEWYGSDPLTVTRYKIYRNNILIHTTGAGVTTYIDEQVEMGSGSNKTYKVRGVSGDLLTLSANYSNEVSISGTYIEKHSTDIFLANKPKIKSEISNIYPNPFNPETKIEYSVGDPQNVNIAIFDVMGREVSALLNEVKSVGIYEISFNASYLSSGIYYCRMKAGLHTETRKIVLQK